MDIDGYIKRMKKFTDELSKSPEKCKRFLIEAGIYDKNGNLTKWYRKGTKYENGKR